jgi:protein SCO1
MAPCRPWLADIIFTRCPGPCARMTQRLRDLQAALPADPRVKLVSLTTDPAFDTPEVLAKYGQRFGADPARWWFLTGDKREIVKLAVEGLKLTTLDKEEAKRESPNDLFIHSTNLILVDQQGRLRASFLLTGLDTGDDGAPVEPMPWSEIQAGVVEAVNQLLRE